MKILAPIGARIELQRCVNPRYTHVVQGVVASAYASHDLIPGPFDRRAVRTNLVIQAGRLNHPLTGGDVGR